MYDLEIIEHKSKIVRHHFPNFKLKYSLKANSFRPVVQHLTPLVDGFDVSSWDEYDQTESCHERGNISITGPAKNPEMLQFICLLPEPPLIHVESPREVELLDEFTRGRRDPLRVALRIAPPMSTSGGQKMTRFGLTREEAHELLDNTPPGLKIVGYQCYWGTQNLDAEALNRDLEKVLEWLSDLFFHGPRELTYLNLGGGFGVPYFEGEVPLEIEKVGLRYEELRKETNEKFGFNPDWYLELGRYLVAESGRYESTVVDKRFHNGITHLVLEGGMHHFLAASGNLGQLYQRNYLITSSSEEVDTPGNYDIVGSLCTPIDTLGRNVSLPHTDIGDTITIWRAGAYGYEASPHGFLLNQPPERVVQ